MASESPETTPELNSVEYWQTRTQAMTDKLFQLREDYADAHNEGKSLRNEVAFLRYDADQAKREVAPLREATERARQCLDAFRGSGASSTPSK
uniref:Lipoprotein n=1 Tax=Panagrellus redivivus TaxID=6233 RepID=A0A7E5A1B7_PANRE